MKKLSIITLVVVSMTFAGLAEAAKTKKRTRNANRVGAYGGAFLGYTSYSGDQSDVEAGLEQTLIDTEAPIQNLTSGTEDTDIGYQAVFGYRFMRYLAAEIGLAQFGELKSTARADVDFGDGFVPTSVSLTYSAGGPMISAIGILPLNDKFEFFGRLGYLFASTELEFTSRVDGQGGYLGSAKGDSGDPVFGVGFSWHINQIYSIRAEFQKMDSLGDSSTGEQDLTVVGAGVIIRF